MLSISPLIQRVKATDALAISGVAWLLYKLLWTGLRQPKATRLRGPPSKSLIFGIDGIFTNFEDAGDAFEKWAEEYGAVFQAPSVLGSSWVVLNDPKAIAHFYTMARDTYVNSTLSKTLLENLTGKGLLWADGEAHKRQRKALTPAFSNAAAKSVWDVELVDSSDGVIEVQSWMNRISLDTIGIAGFSHDFGTLDGKPCTVADIFESFGGMEFSSLAKLCFLLAPVFPCLAKLPTGPTLLTRKLSASMGEISEVLLAQTRQEAEGSTEQSKEKSLIGLLIKAEDPDSEIHLAKEEVTDQMKVLLLAGNATTSSKELNDNWALLRLAQNPDIQTKLREELAQLSSGDPSSDQLNNSLPYLDAVVHEVLRLHPPVPNTVRVVRKRRQQGSNYAADHCYLQAAHDDVLPLSEPIQTSSGEMVDHVVIPKGTTIMIHIGSINRSAKFWGSDTKEFKPERWLWREVSTEKVAGIQGHRHLLTFIDGPRACLGKGFAITQLKAVLSVLIRSFTFEIPGGSETKVEVVPGVLPRPRIVGEEGYRVPLKVRRAD
ncbi:cytochrome P450 [Leucogyrophana mollusca]|uniref:Cytochrome P450 n=1 Tax=Leucogyrophana mollusca TaxID=85980 RepID=A0ACB8BGN7_9AGAM|nr:cytochrome P450 [Leucogyrophana mollusca]